MGLRSGVDNVYIMMAAAAWLVWREGGWNVQGRPLGLFLLLWALNALWTPIFFAMHRAGLAFRRNRRALADACRDADIILASQGGPGALLLPYLAWVSFAAALNRGIWRLNR